MKITVQKTVVKLGVEHVVSRTLVVAPFGVPAGIPEDVITQKGGLIAGTAAGAVTELPPGSAGQVLTPNPGKVQGLEWAYPVLGIADPTNYLTNGGFDFAQRQAPATLTTIADNKYGPDRWRLTRANADLQYARVSGVGVAGLVSPSYGQFKKITTAGKFLVAQILENINTVPMCGQTVIFQAKLWGSAARTVRMAILELQAAGTADSIPASLVSAWGADGTDPTLGANLAIITGAQSKVLTTAPQTFSVSVTIPSNSKNLLCCIWSDAGVTIGDSVYMAEASLRFGSAQLSWTPRPVAQELVLCQRYYQKSFPLDTAPAQNAGQAGVHTLPCTGASHALRLTVRLTVPMFIVPTITTYNPAAANAQARDYSTNADCTGTASAGTYSSRNSIMVYAFAPVGGAVADDVALHWSAEAEL